MTTLLPIASATPAATLAQMGGGFFAGMFIFGLVILGVFVIGGIGSFVGLIYIWVRACKQPSLAQGLANCGRCGYGVRGSATLQCPECGADFREVGIASPAMRRPFISPALFITLWSLCLWIPGCIVSSVFVAVGPSQQVLYEDVDLEPTDMFAAGYSNFMISRTPYSSHSNWNVALFSQNSDYLDLNLYGNGGSQWCEIDLKTNTYNDFNSVQFTPKPFDRATLETWVGNTGGDLKRPDVQQQIDQAYNNIQQTQAKGLTGADWSAFTVNSKSNWTEDQPAGWFVLVQPVFWLLVYVGGIVLYFVLKNRYDKIMIQLRDRALADDPHASPPMSDPTPTHPEA